jgi:transglutaminase-like putative cysteine protease
MINWWERPLLDLGSVDLDEARRVDYLLWQRFRYDYDGPVSDVRQRIVAVPRARHGALHRRAHRVAVTVPGHADASPPCRVDRRGNLVVSVRLTAVLTAVEFTVAAALRRDGRLIDAALPATSLRAPGHLRPTARTTADDELRAVAGELRATTSDDAEFGQAACGLVKARLDYGFGSTSVHTTAAQAWAIRRGVCQDSAHILLALCRAVGVPARYVSGHLLGEPGGSHAWVEVLVPDRAAARAIAFDPSNGCRAGPRHLPVAVGRDYADVAPTSGWYCGQARGGLTCEKRVGVSAVDVAVVA